LIDRLNCLLQEPLRLLQRVSEFVLFF